MWSKTKPNNICHPAKLRLSKDLQMEMQQKAVLYWLNDGTKMQAEPNHPPLYGLPNEILEQLKLVVIIQQTAIKFDAVVRNLYKNKKVFYLFGKSVTLSWQNNIRKIICEKIYLLHLLGRNAYKQPIRAKRGP